MGRTRTVSFLSWCHENVCPLLFPCVLLVCSCILIPCFQMPVNYSCAVSKLCTFLLATHGLICLVPLERISFRHVLSPVVVVLPKRKSLGSCCAKTICRCVRLKSEPNNETEAYILTCLWAVGDSFVFQICQQCNFPNEKQIELVRK